MNEETKYCKFCGKEKPIKDFVKSGFCVKNICKDCNNKKQKEVYKNSKNYHKLQQENQQLKEQYCERTDCSGRIGNSKKVEELKTEKEQLNSLVNSCQEEIRRLKQQLEQRDNIINKAREYIKTHQRKDEFLDLNEWQTRDLLEILNIDKGEINERNKI